MTLFKTLQQNRANSIQCNAELAITGTMRRANMIKLYNELGLDFDTRTYYS